MLCCTCLSSRILRKRTSARKLVFIYLYNVLVVVISISLKVVLYSLHD